MSVKLAQADYILAKTISVGTLMEEYIKRTGSASGERLMSEKMKN